MYVINSGYLDHSLAGDHQLYLQHRLWDLAVSEKFTNLELVCKDGITVKAHVAVVKLGNNCPSIFWQFIGATDIITVILPDSTKEEVSFALKSFYLERNSSLLDKILGTTRVPKLHFPITNIVESTVGNKTFKQRPRVMCPKRTKNEVPKRSSSRITCDICGLSVSKLREHMLRKHSDSLDPSQATEFKCTECEYSTRIRSTLKQHIYNLHAEKVHQCDKCNFKSALETKLKQHRKKVHGTKTIFCTFEGCKRKFVQECDLKEHIQRVHPQGIFNCHICDKLFVNEHKLKRHVKMHKLDTDGIPCDSCHLKFLTKQKLREHINSHTGETPFRCPGLSCEKAFMSSSSLSHHKKVCPGISKQTEVVNNINIPHGI